MSLDSTLRIGDVDRDRVVAVLGQHLGLGHLTMHELENRLDTAYAARTRGELDAVLADLPAIGPPRPLPSPPPSGPAAGSPGTREALLAPWAPWGADRCDLSADLGHHVGGPRSPALLLAAVGDRPLGRGPPGTHGTGPHPAVDLADRFRERRPPPVAGDIVGASLGCRRPRTRRADHTGNTEAPAEHDVGGASRCGAELGQGPTAAVKALPPAALDGEGGHRPRLQASHSTARTRPRVRAGPRVRSRVDVRRPRGRIPSAGPSARPAAPARSGRGRPARRWWWRPRGALSSRQRPVNRGNRIASPAVRASSRPHPAVWFGERVSSALSTSTTSAGSNHTSAGCTGVHPGRPLRPGQRRQPAGQLGQLGVGEPGAALAHGAERCPRPGRTRPAAARRRRRGGGHARRTRRPRPGRWCRTARCGSPA